MSSIGISFRRRGGGWGPLCKSIRRSHRASPAPRVRRRERRADRPHQRERNEYQRPGPFPASSRTRPRLAALAPHAVEPAADGDGHDVPPIMVRRSVEGRPRQFCVTWQNLPQGARATAAQMARVRRWKLELRKLADLTGPALHVLDYPPRTSKWNKIEDRV